MDDFDKQMEIAQAMYDNEDESDFDDAMTGRMKRHLIKEQMAEEEADRKRDEQR